MVCHSTHSKSLPSDGSSPKDWQITSGIHLHRRGAFGNHFRIHLKTLQSNAHMSFKLVDAMQTCGTARWSPVAPSHVIAPRRRVRALLAGGCTLAMCCINGVLDKIFSWTWASIVPVPCDCLETGPTEKSLHNNPEPPARVFFFLLWPLFARAPRHWFLENFLLSAPGVQSVVFLLRSVGRRDLSAGPEQKKKNTTQGVFFFAPATGKGRGRRSPVGRRHGARAKKKTPPGVFFFFAAAPGKGKGRRSPVGHRHGARAKKKPPVPARGFSFPCLSPGPEQKEKHPGWCFFFVAAAPRGRSLTHCGPGWRCLPLAGVVFLFFAAGRGRTGVVFFFLLWPRPDAHSLTAGLGGDASPSPGWCLFFLLRGGAGPGWCFFFLLWPRPDAHSLTVGWGDFGKARVVFFFCCGPAGSF